MVAIDLGPTEVATALLMLSFTIVLAIVTFIIHTGRRNFPPKQNESDHKKRDLS